MLDNKTYAYKIFEIIGKNKNGFEIIDFDLVIYKFKADIENFPN